MHRAHLKTVRMFCGYIPHKHLRFSANAENLFDEGSSNPDWLTRDPHDDPEMDRELTAVFGQTPEEEERDRELTAALHALSPGEHDPAQPSEAWGPSNMPNFPPSGVRPTNQRERSDPLRSLDPSPELAEDDDRKVDEYGRPVESDEEKGEENQPDPIPVFQPPLESFGGGIKYRPLYCGMDLTNMPKDSVVGTRAQCYRKGFMNGKIRARHT